MLFNTHSIDKPLTHIYTSTIMALESLILILFQIDRDIHHISAFQNQSEGIIRTILQFVILVCTFDPSLDV